MTPDAHLIAEAMRLLDAGRVTELRDVRVFRVRELEESHTAVLTGAGLSGVSCSCDTGRRGELCVACGGFAVADRPGGVGVVTRPEVVYVLGIATGLVLVVVGSLALSGGLR